MMRNLKLLLLLIFILIISCEQVKKEKQTKDLPIVTNTKKTGNFDWLLGKWKRVNEEGKKETFENWKKVKNTEYAGIGFSMKEGDTIKQEKISLTKVNNHWNLVVKVPEEEGSVTFKGTSHKEGEFICENKEIDFPNKIRYFRKGKRINAMVSNGEMEIPFEFEKLTD